ncbi:MAG: GTP-binding protein [Eubacteriales bacterium]
MEQIPVYVFTGFLDSGKTTFIQDTLENPEFNHGERTLLLVLEEGEVEYDLKKFPENSVFMETPQDLSTEKLASLVKKHQAERVVVECNGMEMTEELYEIMPENWDAAQEICFADSNTILTYNDNMRELVVEKILGCELCVFNRMELDADIMPYHALVRAISRQVDIAYTYVDDTTKFDDIEDPLPYDRDADFMEIQDEDFALWYRDLTECETEYDGKSVKFKAQVAQLQDDVEGFFAAGRFVMTCCADDIGFMAVPCYCPEAAKLEQRTWITITADIELEDSPIYDGIGPILRATAMELAEPADPDVAKF